MHLFASANVPSHAYNTLHPHTPRFFGSYILHKAHIKLYQPRLKQSVKIRRRGRRRILTDCFNDYDFN